MEPNIVDSLLEDFYKSKQNCEFIQRLIPDKDGTLTSLPMNNCYINLTVVRPFERSETDDGADDGSVTTQQTSNELVEFRELRHSFNRPRSSEELNLHDKDENHFQIEDLFDGTTDDVSRRIFMLGRAGIGKTTMCKKIVYEYYVNRLWNDKFDRIIWLPLRIFNRESIKELEVLTLAGLYSNHFYSNSTGNNGIEIGKKLADENEIDESKVLYLLDGLDEVQNLVGIKDLAISRIIDDLLSKPFVVVTSRPYTYHDNYSNFDLILETIGFSQENIFDYVRVVFDQPSEIQTQKEIIEFIEKSPTNIAGMVSIPILLDIICFTWTDIKSIDESTQITMTRLYSILDKYLWGQFLIRIEKTNAELLRNTVKIKSEVYALINETAAIDVHMLSEVAYKMLAKNKIEFTTEEAFQLESDVVGAKERILLKNTNFLNCLNPSNEDIREIWKSYTFIHLTIQEYLSAVYLVKCFKENRPVFETAIEYKYSPRYSIVWSFVAGILSDSKEELGYSDNGLLLETFFNFLERNPRDELGIAHQYLMIGCLNECSYPTLLSSEREDRLIDELLSYIWTQYVAGGNSLFTQQQLPLKILRKLISEPDAYWEADSNVFKKKVLREQFLPEEIVSRILNELQIENQRTDSVKNANILITQDYLGLPAIDIISREINRNITDGNASMIEKYLNILRGKSFLPSNKNFLQTIGKLIAYSTSRKKEVKRKVAGVCLNLKEIPFCIIEKLVTKFVKNLEGRKPGVSDDEWKKHLLMGIIREDQVFGLGEMMQLFKQKCFSGIVDDFLNEKITELNSMHLPRLLLVAARRQLGTELKEKLMELFVTETLEYDVKRLVLYVLGNMKTLPETVVNCLFRFLDQNEFTINLTAGSVFNRQLVYERPARRASDSELVIDFGELGIEVSYPDIETCTDDNRDVSTDTTIPDRPAEDNNSGPNTLPTTINFQYLAYIIPLMKFEFYDGHQKKRSRSFLKFKKRRYLSHSQFDMKYIRFLQKNIAATINNRMPSLACKIEFHDELLATWQLIEPFFDSGEDVLDGWHLERGNDARQGRQYRFCFSRILDDDSEWSIDSKMYYDVLVKYRPLVTRAHYLYNMADTSESIRRNFAETCEMKLLELLIVRALRDSKISESSLTQFRSQFLEQIDVSNQNRLKLANLAKILQFKELNNMTIGKIIDFIETGSVDEVQLTLSLLHRQSITVPAHIDKLESILLDNYEDLGMQKKCLLVANVFEMNAKLLKKVQGNLMSLIDGDFNVKLKVLNVLQSCEIKDEFFLLKLPDIIKDCRNESNWSAITGRCVFTLLSQKKLPSAVLDKMALYFDNLEEQYSQIYLQFLDILPMPLTQKCIESLYQAIDDGFVSDLRELAQVYSDSELRMRKVLKKQPLWNLLNSECKYKFKESFGGERKPQRYTIKERIIVEKILHESHLPMAVIPVKNGNRCCFSPFGNSPLVEFGNLNFSGLLRTMFEGRHGLVLNLPVPLDKHHNYLKFHSHEENLKYILGPMIDSLSIIRQDVKIQTDTENSYIKMSKAISEMLIEKLARPTATSEMLIEKLAYFLQATKYRHIDLSHNDLDDIDVYQLMTTLFDNNPMYRVITLILSNNKISLDGLIAILSQLKKSPIDFVFLDRNLISFSEEEYRLHISSDYRSNESNSNLKLNVGSLDLTLNFISSGERIYGDPFADREITQDRQYDMKDSIQKIAEIHSQNLGDKIFEAEADPLLRIQSLCHSMRYPNQTPHEYITINTGCVMVAEKRPVGLLARYIFNRGHAFMVIEWIPDTEYGQRQIILADLNKDASQQDRLTIRITTISPLKLKENVENCVSARTIFRPNVDVANKLMPRLFQSKKQVDIFDYFAFPSMKDREVRGRYNCITWTDEMLKGLDIQVDGMHRSRTRLMTLTSISVVIIAVVFYFIFRFVQQFFFLK